MSMPDMAIRQRIEKFLRMVFILQRYVPFAIVAKLMAEVWAN